MKSVFLIEIKNMGHIPFPWWALILGDMLFSYRNFENVKNSSSASLTILNMDSDALALHDLWVRKKLSCWPQKMFVKIVIDIENTKHDHNYRNR